MALEVKAHWTIAISGDGADEINLIKLLNELIEAEKLKIEISSAHVSTHYTEKRKASS